MRLHLILLTYILPFCSLGKKDLLLAYYLISTLAVDPSVRAPEKIDGNFSQLLNWRESTDSGRLDPSRPRRFCLWVHTGNYENISVFHQQLAYFVGVY